MQSDDGRDDSKGSDEKEDHTYSTRTDIMACILSSGGANL